MSKYKDYTDQQIIDAVKASRSISQVLKALGLAQAGGNYANIQRNIQRLLCDTSHFTGKGWNKDQQLKDWSSYSKAANLKPHLIKKRTHQCEQCNLSEWLSEQIKLEIHHIDGDRTNNVEENLQFFATMFGTTIEENYDLIRDIYIQIEPFKKRRAGALSGGMKQKLALCCALIHKPKVLFLDEPTTGVDPVSRKEFWEMLKRLQQNGITILVSTPYMDEASLCDRIALIQKGKIFEIDSPKNIISKYSKTIYAVSARNTHQLLGDLKAFPSQYSVFAFGEFIHYIDQNSNFKSTNLQQYLESKRHTEITIQITTPTIEDVFMDVTSLEN